MATDNMNSVRLTNNPLQQQQCSDKVQSSISITIKEFVIYCLVNKIGSPESKRS